MSAESANGSLTVVGAINVDFVVVCERLPRPGETVVGSSLQRHGGGKGANAAFAAARAGAKVRLVCAVGRDAMAESALADLRRAGVDLSGVAELEHVPTGAALIVVDAEGENQIAVGGGANSALSAEWVNHELSKNEPPARCLLVSTEIPQEAVAAAVRAGVRAGIPCLVNAAPPLPVVVDLLEMGIILTPNLHELAQLADMLGLEPSLAPSQRAAALAARTDRPVVVTMGGEGALIVTSDGTREQIRPPVVDVRDTTGAGDTFNGVFAAQLANGHDLSTAVRTAVAAAAMSVSHSGARAGMPTLDELERAQDAASASARST